MNLRTDNEQTEYGAAYEQPGLDWNDEPYNQVNRNNRAPYIPYRGMQQRPVQPQTVRPKEPFPIVTVVIIAANIIAAILCIGVEDVFALGGINYEYITINKEYGRFLSYMFLHAGFDHLMGNMLSLFLFGHAVEAQIGAFRMAILYFGSGVGAGIFSMEMAHILHPSQTRYAAGASGAIFGVACAFVYLAIVRHNGRRNYGILSSAVFSSGTSKRRDMIVAIAILVIYAVFSGEAGVDVYGHVGGALFGGLLAFLLTNRKWDGFRENLFFRILGILITGILCVAGVGEAGLGRDQASLMDEKVTYIRESPVRASDGTVYEHATYGEALDDYCTDEKWQSFESEDHLQVVQFDGKAYYKGGYKQICIQFLITGDCEAYELSYFSMDETPVTWEDADKFLTTIVGLREPEGRSNPYYSIIMKHADACVGHQTSLRSVW